MGLWAVADRSFYQPSAESEITAAPLFTAAAKSLESRFARRRSRVLPGVLPTMSTDNPCLYLRRLLCRIFPCVFLLGRVPFRRRRRTRQLTVRISPQMVAMSGTENKPARCVGLLGEVGAAFAAPSTSSARVPAASSRRPGPTASPTRPAMPRAPPTAYTVDPAAAAAPGAGTGRPERA